MKKLTIHLLNICALILSLHQTALASWYAKVSAATAVCAAPIPPNAPSMLYDSTLGNLPSNQQWQFVSSPGATASQAYSNGLTVLDTFTQVADSAGYFVAPTQPITLDRSLGFVLNLSVEILTEAHNNANRAGFSIIVIASDGKGIELGFWDNSVWAQGDGIQPSNVPLFNHAESATFNTSAPVTYQLGLVTDTYALMVNGTTILSGPVRNYSAFNGFPDPYETPNLIFIGDDTTSARATVALGSISVQTCAGALSSPIVPTGSSWKYRDDGVDLGPTWRDLNYDDSSWQAGSAPLGYGDPVSTTLSFGGDANNKTITAYFRQMITVENPLRYAQLSLSVLRDDGAVVYLNGQEVLRSNMPTETTILSTTLAVATIGGADEAIWHTVALSPSQLLTGANVIAAEVHQSAPNSSDLRFALQLGDDTSVLLPPPPAGTTRFAVIGDFGKTNSQENIDVSSAIKTWNVDFVTTVGDNSYCYGANAPADPYDDCVARYYHAWISPYVGKYGAGALENRFWPVMGNHDWDTGLIKYTSAFSLPNNERYYELRRGSVHFFMLSSDPREPDGNTMTSVQGQWLQAALAQSTAPWKLVYMHHPPYSSSSVHGSSTWMQWPFKGWGATAVLAGHDHTYERIDQTGLPYFVSGLGGNSIYPFSSTPIEGSVLRYNADYGAMLVDASDCEMVFRFVTRTGVVVDTYSQTRTCSAPTPTPTPTLTLSPTPSPDPNLTIRVFTPLAIR